MGAIPFVSVEPRSWFDRLADLSAQRVAAHVWDMPGADLALRARRFVVALEQPHDGFLADVAASVADDLLAAAGVHVLRQTADECFVRLYWAGHLLKGAGLHREPDAMIRAIRNQPRRCLR